MKALIAIAIAATMLFALAAKYKEANAYLLAYGHVKKVPPAKVVAYMLGL